MNEKNKFAEAVFAFEKGDFTRAYQQSDCPTLKGAALIMLGLFERGLAALGQPNDDRSKFCAAIACWGLGQTSTSTDYLSGIRSTSEYFAPAKKLASFVNRDKIRILLQAREEPHYKNYNTVEAMRNIPNADVVTIGYSGESDIVIDGKTTLEEMLSLLPNGWSPDFYLCNMIEDHPPPIGIEDAQFTTFYSTQDFDRHYHHCRHLFGLFDGALAFGSIFHSELEKLTGNAFVCPLLMGIDEAAPSLKNVVKSNDIYVSGNLFKHSKGKSKFLWYLSQLPPKYKIVLENRYLSQNQYYERLSQSKYTFTFVQNWGITNSRGFEAAAMGCKSFYQEGSELGIFLEEIQSLVPYSDESFTKTVLHALENWTQEEKKQIESDARKTREVYNFYLVTQRLFFLLAVYSSLIKNSARTATPWFADVRYVNRSPQRVMYCYDHDAEKYLEIQKKFRKRLTGDDSYLAIDAIGESFLYSHLMKRSLTQSLIDHHLKLARAAGRLAAKQVDFFKSYNEHHRSDELQQAMLCYKDIRERYPEKLAGHFNLARLNLEGNLTKEAIKGFEHIVENSSLIYEENDLLFWREFQDPFYDYEDMMFSIRKFSLTGDNRHLRSIERGIRESALYYLVDIELRNNHVKRAGQYLKSFLDEEAQLPALWYIKFKLAAVQGKTDLAREIAREIFDYRPWILVLFGKPILEISNTCNIEINEIYRSVELFQSRVKQ